MDSNNNNLLKITKLHSGYGKNSQIEVLHDININIKFNEVVTLLGANGAGKSTLLLTIMGNPQAKSGNIVFNKQDITQTQTHLIAKHGISIVPEGRRVFPDMTIEDNLKLGAVANANPNDFDYLDRVYQLFPILKQRAKFSAGILSGGEQQMLAIGRALMAKPKLLLLDEPSLGLAPKIVKQIYEILAEIKQTTQTTIFLVEQNIKQAMNFADRYYIIKSGRIVEQGTKEEFLNSSDVSKHYL
jgi:branched-chain amino acid transport system ATP-binding protein